MSEYVPADNGSSTDQISGINSLSTNCHFCSSFSPKAYKSLPLSAASAANAVWEFTESDFLCDNCSCDDPVESFPNGQLRGHDFLPLQRYIVDDKTRESNIVESVVAPINTSTTTMKNDSYAVESMVAPTNAPTYAPTDAPSYTTAVFQPCMTGATTNTVANDTTTATLNAPIQKHALVM